jgi:hypothetical protein
VVPGLVGALPRGDVEQASQVWIREADADE